MTAKRHGHRGQCRHGAVAPSFPGANCRSNRRIFHPGPASARQAAIPRSAFRRRKASAPRFHQSNLRKNDGRTGGRGTLRPGSRGDGQDLGGFVVCRAGNAGALRPALKAWTDATLPMQDRRPPPESELVRVMVGRAELLTPQTEAQLLTLVTKAKDGGESINQLKGMLGDLGRFAMPALGRAFSQAQPTPEQAQKIYSLLAPAAASQP